MASKLSMLNHKYNSWGWSRQTCCSGFQVHSVSPDMLTSPVMLTSLVMLTFPDISRYDNLSSYVDLSRPIT